MTPIVIIPARLASVRLPQKPLALIGHKPMLVHVWERAVAANVGPVVVACDGPELYDLITQLGGIAIQTDPALASGSDRVHAALNLFDPEGKYDVVINLQGDLPDIHPQHIVDSLEPLRSREVDVSTLAAEIKDPQEITNPNVVKIAPGEIQSNGSFTALYFSRASIPSGEGPYYHHIGLYAYRREVLDRFVSLAPSTLEKRERLEQLRLLEVGVSFGVKVVTSIPVSVDTQEDLERARQSLAS